MTPTFHARSIHTRVRSLARGGAVLRVSCTYARLSRYGASTCDDALERCQCIYNAVLRAHLLAQRSGVVSHPGGGGGEVESAGECLSLEPSAIHGGRRDAGQALPRVAASASSRDS